MAVTAVPQVAGEDGDGDAGMGLFLVMDRGLAGEFFPLFEEGVELGVRTGGTLEDTLCGQLGLDPAYVAERITTVFLDGRPIDDMATAVVRDGARIALSGAMPGLVGATMRRGGFYAAMREAISHCGESLAGEDEPGTVRLKLFNLLLPGLVPHFLARGILLEAHRLAGFLAGKPDSFRNGCRRAKLGGEPVSLSQPGCAAASAATALVRLTVLFGDQACSLR